METKVIHIKDAPKGWTRNDQYVYIGRERKIEDNGKWTQMYGVFGNPIIKGKPCPQCGKTHEVPGATVPCYERWLRNKIQYSGLVETSFVKNLKSCYGKTLVCFCKPNPCHGDVLSIIISELHNEKLIDSTWSEGRGKVQSGTKKILMRVEYWLEKDGSRRPVLVFYGSPNGSTYSVNELLDEEWGIYGSQKTSFPEEYVICDGLGGGYSRCTVPRKEVYDYLMEVMS